MDIHEVLDEFEEYVENSRKVPLVNKILLDKEQLLDYIDSIRSDLPEELRQARWIAREREKMLQEAREEAQRIIEESKKEVQQRAQESEIVKEAQKQAENIIKDSKETARELGLNANDYANEVLDKLEKNLEKALATIKEGKEELQQNE